MDLSFEVLEFPDYFNFCSSLTHTPSPTPTSESIVWPQPHASQCSLTSSQKRAPTLNSEWEK